MKGSLTLSALLIVLLTAMTNFQSFGDDAPAGEAAAETANVVLDGVVPGSFTHDNDAAMAYAKEKNLPVLLVFTGSDWCGWCKLMDKNVFSTPDWQAYAKDNLVQVWLDYPKNEELVPEKYRARNEAMKDAYEIRGYPTYIVLDSDGTQLGKLGAGRDKTPASFKAEVQKLLAMTDNGINALAAKLKPEDAKKVKTSFAAYRKSSAEEADLSTKLAAAKARTTEHKTALDAAMEAGKVNAMSDLQKAEYEAARKALAEAQAKLEEWAQKNRKAKPSAELRAKYNELNKAIQDAQQKIDSF